MPPEPLPAELRHRCFGCSLAPVCLPEETLYLIQHPARARAAGTASESRAPAAGGLADPRDPPERRQGRALPAGARLARRPPQRAPGRLDRGQQINRVPIASIRQVVVFGNVQVSTQALHTLAEAEVPVSYLTGYGKFIAAVMPAPAKNVALRADQYRAFADPARSRSAWRGRSSPPRSPTSGRC